MILSLWGLVMYLTSINQSVSYCGFIIWLPGCSSPRAGPAQGSLDCPVLVSWGLCGVHPPRGEDCPGGVTGSLPALPHARRSGLHQDTPGSKYQVTDVTQDHAWQGACRPAFPNSCCTLVYSTCRYTQRKGHKILVLVLKGTVGVHTFL